MEHVLDKEKMEAIEAIAALNLKISETSNNLRELQEKEAEYLVLREEKAVARVTKALNDSSEMLQEINKNYESITILKNSVFDLCEYVATVKSSFDLLIARHDESVAQHENHITEQEQKISQAREEIRIQKEVIEQEIKSIERQKEDLKKQEIKNNDERATLERAIARIKKGKV